jgi:hypothetical protein
MSAANVPIEIDQGEDWTAQIVYTNDFDEPYNIIAPCRMDIKNSQGATQLSLMTPDTEVPDGTIPDILLSSEIGLIQIHIEDSVTGAMMPGVYKYDLFVTVNDGNAYAGDQVQRLIKGEVTVNQRVTTLIGHDG